jgi:hypothetical protein
MRSISNEIEAVGTSFQCDRAQDILKIGSPGRIRTIDQPVNRGFLTMFAEISRHTWKA